MQISQSVAKTIKDRAKKSNIPIGQMLTECGLSKNALSSMQSGGYFPRIENLIKIANCLDCSIDYLLGRTDNPQAHKSNSVVFGDLSNNSGIVGNVGSTINSEPTDSEVMELAQLIKSLPLVKRAEAILAINKIKTENDIGGT